MRALRPFVTPLVVLGCASQRPVTTGPGPRADLPPAAVAGNDGAAETGTPSAVAEVSRRVQVEELYGRYARALRDRSLDDLRPLFDDRVTGFTVLDTVSRAQVLAMYDQVLQAAEPPGGPVPVPSISSYAAYAAANNVPAAVRPGDWVVEGRHDPLRRRNAPANGPRVSQALLVRWVDGVPRVVGVDDGIVQFLRR